MNYTKHLFAFFLLISIFSINSLAQSPTDDPVEDPGGDVYTLENGYAEGAAEAAYLKESLASSYFGSVASIEWHLYSNNATKHVGAQVDFNSPGLKVAVIVWNVTPTEALYSDQSAMDFLSYLFSLRNNSNYDEGFYQGFLDHWYEN
ncbi:MAG: hypothetical protein JWQ96_131 [Segetibacter sp.]|nr:hypothetical protein [Segetibacter sp.]